MPKSKLFDKNRHYYDEWFDKHPQIYHTELEAIQRILPPFKKGLEIGVGTGRFAKPLGIEVGVEPSEAMAQIAKSRGIQVVPGVAKKLPFADESFDLVLMVTTICFVDDADRALQEIHRILTPKGDLILAFVDKESDLGRFYLANRDKSRFYKEATFYSKKEIFKLLKKHGFILEACNESLFGDTLTNLHYEIVDGCKKGGAFLVLRAKKREAKAKEAPSSLLQ